jgi:hypothetical protein
MKKQGCILHKMILAMFLLLAVGVGYAQEGIKVSVPFDFTVGKQTFPAGEYTVAPMPMSLNKMLLRNRTGEVLIFMQTNPAESRERANSARLVFNQYGGEYFLTQIWQGGSDFGQQLIKSSVEIEMARATQSRAQLVALSSAPNRQ